MTTIGDRLWASFKDGFVQPFRMLTGDRLVGITIACAWAFVVALLVWERLQ